MEKGAWTQDSTSLGLAYRELFMADWSAVFLVGSVRSVWEESVCKLTCAGFQAFSVSLARWHEEEGS
jgi:hypothetical protein